MRLDMGIRASAIADNRSAAAHDPKYAQELYDKLMRFAL
jgi:hypothetical protein